MSCYYCKKVLTTINCYNYFMGENRLCNKCVNDDTVVLSYSAIKKLYMITETESELQNNDIFCITIRYRRKANRKKYLVDDIEKYVDSITKNDKSRQRKKYLQQKEINDRYRTKRELIRNKKNFVKSDLKLLSLKIDKNINIDNFYFIDIITDNYCRDIENHPPLDISLSVFNILFDYYTFREKFIKQLDSLLVQHISWKYNNADNINKFKNTRAFYNIINFGNTRRDDTYLDYTSITNKIMYPSLPSDTYIKRLDIYKYISADEKIE